MLSLTQLRESSEAAFSGKIGPFTPSTDLNDRISAFKKCGLTSQISGVIFKERQKAVNAMGFQNYTREQFIEMLTGKEPDYWCLSDERHDYEWTYNHHTKQQVQWSLPVRKFWSTSWFRKRLEYNAGGLNYLKTPMPYGVVLRINELKEAKIFNAFSCIAPKNAWIEQEVIDPIVIGEIWELPTSNSIGEQSLHFIAQW